MDDKIIDVNYTEMNKSSSMSNKYYTIEEVAEKLSIDVSKIIYWCNKLNSLLKIQIIGMYPIFDEDDVQNLRNIKKLSYDKKMNIKEIKNYLKNNEKAIIRKKDIQIPEISLLTVIAKILNNQNEKINVLTTNYDKTLELNKILIENQNEIKNLLNKKETSQEQVAISVDKIMTKKLDTSMKDLKQHIEEKDKENNQATEIQLEEFAKQFKEFADSFKSDKEELVKLLKEDDEKKQQEQKLEELKQPFWKKWFK